MSRADRLAFRPGGVRMETLDRDGALRETAEQLPRIDAGACCEPGRPRRWSGRSRGREPRSAADRKADFGVLNYALSLEYLQAAFYTEAERLGSLEGKFREQARVVGAHERAHVEALQALLGASAIKRPEFDFQGVTEDQSKFRATAVAFEDLAAAAYKEEAPRLNNPEFLAAAIRVHSVEARHAAWIRRLAGALPAADAFDKPKSRTEVKRLVASTKFVVTDPVTRSRGEPRFTG